MKHISLPILVLATAALAECDESSLLFRGSTGYVAVVRVDAVDGTTCAVPEELRGIQLLNLDAVGRTAVECWIPGCTQRVEGPQGSARLVLPSGASLHHFTRIAVQGARFGYFLEVPGRDLRIVYERDGIGPNRDQDPFLSHVAIDASGRGALVATTLEAGGDLLEIELGTGTVHDRTAGLDPVPFTRTGMGLADDWGWAATRKGVLRFKRVDTAIAQLAPVVGASQPSFWTGEAAASRNGQFVITTAGSAADQLTPWIFSIHGPLIAASAYVGPMGPAGYLPMNLGGPYLAVSNDGRLSGWRQDAVTQEGFCCRTLVPGPLHTVEVTADAYMLDTLDAVGIVGFFDPTRLTMGVGERDAGGIDKFDLYGLSIDVQGALEYTNNTQTSFDTTVPFQAVPGLSMEGLTWVPEVQEFLAFNDDAETLVRSQLDPGGTLALLPDVKDLFSVTASGDRILVNVRRSSGNQVHELHSIQRDLTGPVTPVIVGVDNVEYVRAIGDGNGRAMVVQVHEFGGEQALLLDLRTGQSTALLPTLADKVGTLRFETQGRILVESFDAGGSPTVRAFATMGAVPTLMWSRALELMP